ncbi:MAG: hypothetical protein KME12_23420 [Trichocoleus desertorum ATA4-8-CV12]|jgi:hypothetical protein|nr:hypothetical protein [Trichocoleus desertorum ATA4-8-CV12]
MGALLPRIGTTSCTRAITLLENQRKSIVGTFWVMSGYGFDESPIPDWWTSLVREDNQAQAILDANSKGYFSGGHNNPLYLGFCIVVVANQSDPANFSYVIEHLRMCKIEGLELLELLAKHNIPAHTEVTYPMSFLNTRYEHEKAIPRYLKTLDGWSTQVWEDYCSYLLAEHGQSMIEGYWSNPS